MNQNVNLVITIDVEEDMPYWKAEESVTVRNISAIPRLQKLFDTYGIKPTYLLTYPVAEDNESISIFKGILETGRCEIGSHLHPWTTPPCNQSEKDQLIVPSALEENLLKSKLNNLTGMIKKSFGIFPVSYRAGRFGFDKRSAEFIVELGYKIDTSVTPLHSWREINGPEFLYDNVEPGFLQNKYGVIDLLEVPVSIALTRNLNKLGKCIYLNLPNFTRIKSLLSKDYLNLLDILWLYPAHYSTDQMLVVSDILVSRNCNVLNMFLHSSEVSAGESIYNKTEKDIDYYFDKLDVYFKRLFSKYRVTAMTLSEYRNHFILESQGIKNNSFLLNHK